MGIFYVLTTLILRLSTHQLQLIVCMYSNGITTMLRESGSAQLGYNLVNRFPFGSHAVYMAIHAYLNKDSAVSVGVRVDGARGSLPAHIAGEGHAHPPPWGLCEERPWQRGHLRPVSPTGGLGRALHPRPRRPAPPRGGAHHQPHGRILQMRDDNVSSTNQPDLAKTNSYFHHQSHSQIAKKRQGVWRNGGSNRREKFLSEATTKLAGKREIGRETSRSGEERNKLIKHIGSVHRSRNGMEGVRVRIESYCTLESGEMERPYEARLVGSCALATSSSSSSWWRPAKHGRHEHRRTRKKWTRGETYGWWRRRGGRMRGGGIGDWRRRGGEGGESGRWWRSRRTPCSPRRRRRDTQHDTELAAVRPPLIFYFFYLVGK